MPLNSWRREYAFATAVAVALCVGFVGGYLTHALMVPATSELPTLVSTREQLDREAAEKSYDRLMNEIDAPKQVRPFDPGQGAAASVPTDETPMDSVGARRASELTPPGYEPTEAHTGDIDRSP